MSIAFWNTSVKKGLAKIPVQVAAVQRRENDNGSRTAVVKGMRKKNNPFEIKIRAAAKRPHNLSLNVEKTQPVPKKAGRSMSSKTKALAKRSKTKISKIKK